MIYFNNPFDYSKNKKTNETKKESSLDKVSSSISRTESVEQTLHQENSRTESNITPISKDKFAWPGIENHLTQARTLIKRALHSLKNASKQTKVSISSFSSSEAKQEPTKALQSSPSYENSSLKDLHLHKEHLEGSIQDIQSQMLKLQKMPSPDRALILEFQGRADRLKSDLKNVELKIAEHETAPSQNAPLFGDTLFSLQDSKKALEQYLNNPSHTPEAQNFLQDVKDHMQNIDHMISIFDQIGTVLQSSKDPDEKFQELTGLAAKIPSFDLEAHQEAIGQMEGLLTKIQNLIDQGNTSLKDLEMEFIHSLHLMDIKQANYQLISQSLNDLKETIAPWDADQLFERIFHEESLKMAMENRPITLQSIDKQLQELTTAKKNLEALKAKLPSGEALTEAESAIQLIENRILLLERTKMSTTFIAIHGGKKAENQIQYLEKKLQTLTEAKALSSSDPKNFKEAAHQAKLDLLNTKINIAKKPEQDALLSLLKEQQTVNQIKEQAYVLMEKSDALADECDRLIDAVQAHFQKEKESTETLLSQPKFQTVLENPRLKAALDHFSYAQNAFQQVCNNKASTPQEKAIAGLKKDRADSELKLTQLHLELAHLKDPSKIDNQNKKIEEETARWTSIRGDLWNATHPKR